jgi:hypothetical protein
MVGEPAGDATVGLTDAWYEDEVVLAVRVAAVTDTLTSLQAM